MRLTLTAAVASVLILSGSAAFAATDLGPVASYGDEGGLSLGLGYAYYAAKWKSDNSEIPVGDYKRSFGYLQLNYAFTHAWEAYARVGFANAEYKLGYPFDSRFVFKDGFKPAVAIGVKGLAHNGDKWDAGPFVQYNVYSSHSDKREGNRETVYLRAEQTYDSMWDLAIGGAFGYESDFAVLTFAPYIFWSRADTKLELTEGEETETHTGKIEEKNIIGGMLGVIVPMGDGFLFNAETQYQSNLSVSISVTKVFGSHE